LKELADLVVALAGARALRREGIPADRARIDIGSYHADDSAFRAAANWAPDTTLTRHRTDDRLVSTRLADYL